MSKPLVVDLFCGLGGWSDGFLAEGYDCVGFDIERHDYGTGGYPGQLVLQDVLQLSGKQFSTAAAIVASPPCQTYSYMAMPWKRAKELARQHREDITYQLHLNCLFNSCFRIAHEAGVPLIVENVKGAQPWVGQARAHFGSFYFWGDIDTVGGSIVSAKRLKFGQTLKAPRRASKNAGGSWFAIGSPGQTNVGQNPDGRKLPAHINESIRQGKSPATWTNPAEHYLVSSDGVKVGIADNYERNKRPQLTSPEEQHGLKVPSMTSWDGYGKPGYKPQGFNVEAARRYRENGTKGFAKSDSRKAASAQIAKIPFPLASYIARVFKP